MKLRERYLYIYVVVYSLKTVLENSSISFCKALL